MKQKVKNQSPNEILPRLLFWDIDPKTIDFKKDWHYVIERILEYGDIPEIRWMLSFYTKDQIKEILISSRNLTQKSANFWADFLEVPKNQVRCLNRQFQKQQKVFWPY